MRTTAVEHILLCEGRGGEGSHCHKKKTKKNGVLEM